MKTKMYRAALAVVTLAAALVSGNMAYAQAWPGQATACPGWNNPNNFGATYFDINDGTTHNCYSGRTGDAVSGAPNVSTQTTGVNLTSVLYTGTALANVTDASGATGAQLPNVDKQFYIHTAPGTDPNTQNRLPYIPSQMAGAQLPGYNTTDQGQFNTNLTRSIRIGDGCGQGKAAALYYEFVPNVDNAVFVIYYAVVVQGPEHGITEDPSFVIRVMEKNASNQWVQKSDTLAYYVTSTCDDCTPENGIGERGTAHIQPLGVRGWHDGAGSGSSHFKYKDWEKVVVNLGECLDEPHRIEIIMRDCIWTAHSAYAYICGECRPMTINSTGCPPGRSTDVTTLQAPRGMLEYEWQASEYGYSSQSDLAATGPNNYFTFRTLFSGTEADSAYNYHVQADDFRVLYRPVNEPTPIDVVDSFAKRQTFRCNMKSAINPAVPFWQPLYVDVTNNKPRMEIDTLVECDGKLSVWNRSEVPGSPNLAQLQRTTYSLYNNSTGAGTPYYTVTGTDAAPRDSLEYYLTNRTTQSLVVRTVTTDPTCYSEELYVIEPLWKPDAGMRIADKLLCDGDHTTITDTTRDVTWRQWAFLKPTSHLDDTVPLQYDYVTGSSATENKTLSDRDFGHDVEPIELTVRNGLFYLDTATRDTVWCEDKAYDTVRVFLNPNLVVSGETIVCEGEKTAAKVEAEGMTGCTYEWSLTNGTVSGGLPAGDSLKVVPYADTAVYYVKVTSPDGCSAWSSTKVYLVKPRVSMTPAEGICPGGVAVLTGRSASKYTWEASPADPSLDVANADSAAVVNVSPKATTTYKMWGYGTNGCKALPQEITVKVLPRPTPAVDLTPGYIDVDDPTVLLRDVSQNGVNAMWTFDNGTTAMGREVSHTFEGIVDKEDVAVTLTTYNALNCDTNYVFTIPVRLFTTWFPNIFTPGSEDQNSKFKLYTANEYEQFHIYIYNRQGMMVYESADPAFEWDGTRDGELCEQGAYVYICYYRKPGTPTLATKKGTVTLVR